MISSQECLAAMAAEGVTFFTGVPDSLLKEFCAYLTDRLPANQHVIAANEGNAIGIATGYHLATGKIPVVYLQNSGLGNTINPLTSLVDPAIYAIPCLLLVGWRAEPGVHDEPQHVVMGRVQVQLLDALNIPHYELPTDPAELAPTIATSVATARQRGGPVAFIVRKGTFEPYQGGQKTKVVDYPLTREAAIEKILAALPATAVVVSTTGKTSREVFELRERGGSGHERDFLTVGSMGHASSIALGIALAQPDRSVWCLDGDGAAIMHLGALTVIGQRRPANLVHIILNNQCHESVGGQPTAAATTDFLAAAKAAGYQWAESAASADELAERLKAIALHPAPCLLEVRCRPGSRDDLGRPTTTPLENKQAFMGFLERS